MVNLKLNAITKNITKALDSRTIRVISILLIFIIILPVLLLALYTSLFIGKIYPNTQVADIPLSGLTPEQAIENLTGKIKQQNELQLIADDSTFDIKNEDINLKYDINESVSAAYNLYRTGNILYDINGRIKLLTESVNLGLRFSYNKEKLEENLSVIAGQVSTDTVYPTVTIIDKNVVIEKGTPGKDIDRERLLNNIWQIFAFPRNQSLTIPLVYKDPSWDENQQNQIKQRAEKLVGKSLTFTLEGREYIYKDIELVSLLEKDGGYNSESIDEIFDKLKVQVNRNPVNSVFVFNTGKVEEFTPSKDGLELDNHNFKSLLISSLRKLEISQDTNLTAELPAVKTPPNITTGDVNNLGIKEMIGRGVSKFAGSISSRVHNIGLAASRFNGIIVEPNKEISFNEILGDVSAYTGYKQAYVIRDGKTVLGDGGGVCQVSTTLFRALLNAGLPITERRAHSYRVGYYEQGSPPGIDATVFSPTTDLKFKNDTPGHILIQTIFDPKKYELVFEIYGTKDGRIASVTKPVVSAVIAPPEDLYIDDPTLPTGTVKQIDFKAWGAKASFNYKVEKDGVTLIDKVFVSNYRAWQAKFMKGTGPAI